MEIKNKVIIVTGASHGIGRAIAELLSRDGARVVMGARSTDVLAELAHKLPNSLAVETDMRKPDDIQNLVDRAMEKFGRIDIVINNAGQGIYSPVEHINIEQWKEVMDLNVYSVVRMMEAVIPHMREQGGGMIVNISSRVSKNHFPGLAAYAATKYALNAISFTAREELEKDKIIVSVMHPKMTATEFGKNAIGRRPNAAGRGATTTAQAQRPAMAVDTAEQVAEKTLELIRSEAPEAEM